jgi:hypothetical protein
MILFKYNADALAFERTRVIVKYRLTIGFLIFFLLLLSSFTIDISKKSEVLRGEILQKEDIIAGKINIITNIKEPLRDETYVKDLYKSINFELTPNQYERFEYLSLRYRDDIEEAKVPATLVWWTAYKESRFDPEQKNSESTAKGMFQFLDGTWNEVCKLKGFSEDNRLKESKQVKVMLAYLNYLYNKYSSWEKSMVEYHGGEYQYPIKFLFK